MAITTEQIKELREATGAGRDVADHAVVMGNPARQAGYVCKCATKLTAEGAGKYRCPACGDQYTF